MSELRVGSISNKAGTGPVDLSNQWAARSRVKLNGSTFGIYDSENVSSSTDNGTGDYDISFTNSYLDDNYSVSGSHQIASVTSHQRISEYFTNYHNSLHTTASGSADADPISTLSIGELA